MNYYSFEFEGYMTEYEILMVSGYIEPKCFLIIPQVPIFLNDLCPSLSHTHKMDEKSTPEAVFAYETKFLNVC